MMRAIFSIIILGLLLSLVFASSNNYSFYHETPVGVIKGEDVTFEVMLTASNARIYDMHLFYREVGRSDYSVIQMKRDGYLYHVTLNTSGFTTGQLQYYIGYEGGLGEIGTLPDESPQLNPYAMHIAPSRQNIQDTQLDIVVLSPEPDEVIPNDELVIAASLLGVAENFDISKTQLLIDGTNVTSLIDFSEEVISFSPGQIKAGHHNIELALYDAQDNLVGKKEWSFRASGAAPTLGKSYYRGNIFLENRYQNIFENSDNYFRAGGQFRGRYNALDYMTRIVYSSEESDDRQSVNRYAAQLQYNFSERNHIYLKGGDFVPFYNQLTFYNKRVRGIQSGLAFGFFTFDFVAGQLNRSIEGTSRVDSLETGDPNNPVVLDTLVGFGTYDQSVLAFRPGFRFGDNVAWNLNLVNAKEDKNSIKFGSNVKESIVVGTDLNMNFDNRRILFDASFQASINNSNAGIEEVEYDSLAKVNEDLADNSTARNLWDLLKSTGMISMTQGLNPLPSLAMHLQTTLRYFNNALNFKYINIEGDFATAANPYLLKDISGLYINDNFRMINNQVFVNLFYNNFNNNKSSENLRTSNDEFGGTITYLPMQNIPSVTIGYTNILRSNNVTASDTADFSNPELFIEDNTTSKFTFTATYNVVLSDIRNALSFNITNFGRNEAVEARKESESDFTLYSIGLRSKFNFPLITRINYSQSESIFGTANRFETSINRIFLGLEYQMVNLFANDRFRPFVNLIFQNIENIYPAADPFDTTRNHYTFGFSYRNQNIGVLSLRFDQISYQVPGENSTAKDFSDSILNARYEYHF
jgi:hypothetical protein